MSDADNPPPATSPESDAEFDAFLTRIGHHVAADRRRGLRLAYADAKRQAAALRKHPLPAVQEPSNTFSLLPYRPTREGGE